MARICFLLTVTPWNDRRQYLRQAPALAADGNEVIYMAGYPDNDRNDNFRYIPLSKASRRLCRRLGSINLFCKVRQLRPDVIQLCSIEQLPLGLLIKLFTKTKVIYDCREDMYNSMRYSKTRFAPWIRVLLGLGTKCIEKIAAKMFDGFIVSDPSLSEIHSAVPENKKLVFHNTALLSMFKKVPEVKTREYDLCLLGGMTERSGFVVLLETMKKLYDKGRKVKVLLIGEPDAEMHELLRSPKYADIISTVHMTGRVDHREVPELLTQSKIGLVLLLDLPKFRNNIACKAFEYMAAGMPVISSDLPPERLFIEHDVTGMFFSPGNIQQLCNAVEFLLEDLDKAESMGKRGRLEVEEKWNCENEQKNLIRFYKEVLS